MSETTREVFESLLETAIKSEASAEFEYGREVDKGKMRAEPAFVTAARKVVAGSERFCAAVDAEEAKILGRPEPSK